jgi:hypothetical protein
VVAIRDDGAIDSACSAATGERLIARTAVRDRYFRFVSLRESLGVNYLAPGLLRSSS